ncbi:rsgA [Symbiodinium natans]|uniref:RsgA protein n=1 Tax=Symbiodinium natans TaxID=878477 RepID=A0A812KXD5_9DINO|nr:rsgA [Symbiodinium natans]
MCPFSIRFSQARIRPTFQDGREVEASMEQIAAVSCPEGPLQQRYDVLLRAPFPPIEIIRWWPKLREEDGETLLDENGKTILGEPCWFTFDNRRLYCLQAAAIKNWPSRSAAVVHVMHDLPVSKCAPKKFRTTDLGCSVRISRRDDVVPKATWTWMEAKWPSHARPSHRAAWDASSKRDGLAAAFGFCAIGARHSRPSRPSRTQCQAKNKGKKGRGPTLADIEARLRERKRRRESLKRKEELAVSNSQMEETEETEETEEAEEAEETEEEEAWDDFGRATGRVVGGAERHGQVLVKVTDSNEATICQIPRGRRAPKLQPIVGDEVSIVFTAAAGDAEAVVEEVLPRKSTLVRRRAGTPQAQVLCANLDLALLVLSLEPNFAEGMVDRVLVSAHAQGLEVAIVLNKVDLLEPSQRDEVESRLAVYESVGYKVLLVSALEGDNMEELRQLLCGRTSILIGNSGVGKSELLNALGEGQIAAAVGEISERLKLGRHVTTTSTLHRLPGDGEPAYLIDSPGARRFSIWDVTAAELKDHFLEFLPLAQKCKFSNCNHLEEPDCAVKEALEEGRISRQRYDSYVSIRQSLLEGQEGVKLPPWQLLTQPES